MDSSTRTNTPANPSLNPNDVPNVGKFKGELAKWRARVPKLAVALRARDERIRALEAQHREQPLTDPDTRAQLDELQAMSARLADAAADGRARVVHLQAEKARLEGELERAQQALADLTKIPDTSVAAGGQRDDLLAAANVKSDQLAVDLERATEEVHALRSDLATAAQETWKVVQLEADFQRLTVTLREAEAKTEKALKDQAALDEAIAERDQHVATSSDEVNVLRRNLERSTQELETSAERERTAASANERLADENRKLTSELESAHRSANRAADLASENASLRQSMGELENDGHGLRAVANRLPSLEANVVRLESEIANLEQDNAKQESTLEIRDRANSELKDEIGALRSTLEIKQKEIETLEDARGELIERLEAAASHDDNTSVRVSHTYTQEPTHEQALNEKLNARTRERDQASDRVSALAGQIDRLSVKHERAEEAVADLEQRLTASAQENEHLVESLRAAKRKVDGPQNGPLRASDKPAAKAKDDRGLNTDAKTLLVLSQQLDDAREENERLARRIKELEGDTPGAANVDDQGDDLTLIRGIGAKVAESLKAIGITTYRQIAELSDDALDALEEKLKSLKGRAHRDRWIEQATRLDESASSQIPKPDL